MCYSLYIYLGVSLVKIEIACVGSIKEKYYSSACAEYEKRLKKYHNIEIHEVEEERLPKNPSKADIAKTQVMESLRLEKFFKGYVIILDLKGEKLDSVALAKKLEKISNVSFCITFVIGGSYGLSEEIKKKANMMLSFSDFTFPHQLMRVILLEQIYRATTINNNITYHK